MSIHHNVDGYPSCRCKSGGRTKTYACLDVSWTSLVDPVVKSPGWQAPRNTAAPVPPEFLRSYFSAL